MTTITKIATFLLLTTVLTLSATTRVWARGIVTAEVQSEAFDAQSWTLEIMIKNQTFLLELSPNASFNNTQVYANNETSLLDKEHYAGSVIGSPQSWARLSRNNAVLTGAIYVGGHFYLIEDSNNTRDRRASRLAIELDDIGAVSLSQIYPDAVELTQFEEKYLKGDINWQQHAPKVMNIDAIVDSRFDQRYYGEGAFRAAAAINVLDGLYRHQLGLAVKMSAIEVYNQFNDPITQDTIDYAQLLLSFKDQRLATNKLARGRGVVHAFTGVKDSNSRIGLAYDKTLCDTRGYDIGLSDGQNLAGILLAHEISHNIGAPHDEQEASCDATSIMSANFSLNSGFRLSECSIQRIEARLQTAQCITDNTDVSLSAEVTSTIETGEGSAILVLGAQDNESTVNLQIELTEGTTPYQLPFACLLISNDLVECNLLPGQTNGMHFKFNIDQTAVGSLKIHAIPNNNSDLNLENNSYKVSLRTGQVKTTDPRIITPTSAVTGQFDSASGAQGGGGAIFMISILLIASRRK